MKYTSAGRGINGTNLVGCVKSLDTIVSWGCLVWVSGRPSIRVTRPRMTFLEPQGLSLQVLTHLESARFIAWCLRRFIFRRMPTGPEAFWGMLGVSGICPSARTHLKKALYHTRPCDKYRWFYKLINIQTDFTSFGYTAFWPSSISYKFSC